MALGHQPNKTKFYCGKLYKQNQGRNKPEKAGFFFTSARITATRGLKSCKAPAVAVGLKKKFQPNRIEGKKVTAISKWALKITSGGSADMNQTAAKIT